MQCQVILSLDARQSKGAMLWGESQWASLSVMDYPSSPTFHLQRFNWVLGIHLLPLTSTSNPSSIHTLTHRFLLCSHSRQVLLEELRNLVAILLDLRQGNEQVAHKQTALVLLPGPPQRDILQIKVQQLLLRIAQVTVANLYNFNPH